MFLSLTRGAVTTESLLAEVTWVPSDDINDTHPAGKLAQDAAEDGLVFTLFDVA